MTPTPAGQGGISWRDGLALLLCAAAFWAQSWTASRGLPAVADEIAHIVGGESYWRHGINHLQPENGYVAMHWATLPLRLHPPSFPAMPGDLPQGPAMMVIGNRMFYDSGNDPAQMLAAGRAMMAVIGAALVVLIGLWGLWLWGRAGGFLAAGLAAFCPTLLGHGGLVMSDLTLSFFLLLTLTLWWWLLDRPSIARAFACGAALTLLLLSKMSGVLIAPMFVALALWRLFGPQPMSWRATVLTSKAGRAALVVAAGLMVAGISVLGLWAAFGFTFSMFANPAAPLPRMTMTWEDLLRGGGLVKRTVGSLREMHALPEAWLYGLAQTTHTLGGRYSFLNGVTTLGGTPWYFPYAFLVKTPLPLFGLLGLGLAAFARSAPSDTANAPSVAARLHRAAPLVVLFVLYWLFALTTAINIGHRHLLPLYPPLLVLAGGAASRLTAGGFPSRVLTAGLLVWFVAASLGARPHYFAYFNPLAGGSRNGYRHLVDSNVDIGQDLIALKAWLERSPAPAPPLFLSYFGPADPTAHGIRATRFGDHGFDVRPRSLPARVTGGRFCISVTLFQGMYTLTPGPWTAEREAAYQKLLDIATRGTPTSTEATLLEQHQFGRLRHLLATREPEARVGYSILIFRLTDEEVAAALYGPLYHRPAK